MKKLSHYDRAGSARMVDVSAKAETRRTARAHAFVRIAPAVLKKLPCDVFLGAHGDYYGMLDKYERVKSGGANPFIDPSGYRAYVEQKDQAFRKTLADQAAK